MSDIWTMECKECSGSGIEKFGDGPGLDKPCPTCKGAGGWWLGLECCNGPKIKGKSACGVCENFICTDGYRPMTVDEVDYLIGAVQPSMSAKENQERKDARIKFKLECVARGLVTYKGSQVILMPREG